MTGGGPGEIHVWFGLLRFAHQSRHDADAFNVRGCGGEFEGECDVDRVLHIKRGNRSSE